MPGEVWSVEIAVLAPGDQTLDGSGWRGTLRRIVSSDRVLHVLLAAVIVLLGAGLVVSRWVSSSAPVVRESLPQMQDNGEVLLPSKCGLPAWQNVVHACTDEMNVFYEDKHSTGWLYQTALSLNDLNLGHIGGSGWGRRRLCDTPNSRCARTLRGYLDYCPLDPVAVSATTSWYNWTRAERVHGYSNECPCKALTPCGGHIDLLFLRQCLSSAFPDLLTPLTLTSSDVTDANVGSEASTRKTISDAVAPASLRANTKEQERQKNPVVTATKALPSGPLAAKFRAYTGMCEAATAAVFHECDPTCRARTCTPGLNLIKKHRQTDGAGATKWVSSCAFLHPGKGEVPESWADAKAMPDGGSNESRAWLTWVSSGCGCSCYATGTACEAAVANALRVYAQAQASESPGCYSSRRLYNDAGNDGASARQAELELPASALATMLFSARGIRWMPVQ